MIKFVLNSVPRKHLQRIADIAIPLLAPFYMGSAICCPICGGKFRKILPYGYVEKRENALCPRCLSLERHRMMWYYLQNYTDLLKSPNKLLHVAPEYPFIKRFEDIFKKNGGEYITADLESPLAKVKMNVEEIPFQNEFFDMVICNHVLEHVSNDRKALSEIYRVLKSTGQAILLVPIDALREKTYEDSRIVSEQERLQHFGQKDHVRAYGMDYPKRLEAAGFIVKQIRMTDLLNKDQCKKMAFSNEVLYIVNKP